MLPRAAPIFPILMFEFYVSTKTPLSNQVLTEKNNSSYPNLIGKFIFTNSKKGILSSLIFGVL